MKLELYILVKEIWDLFINVVELGKIFNICLVYLVKYMFVVWGSYNIFVIFGCIRWFYLY